MGVVEVARLQAGAEEQPKNNRLAQGAEYAVPLAKKPH
jgi:hypothetical protein